MAHCHNRGKSKIDPCIALCNNFNRLGFKKASKNCFYEDYVLLRNQLLLLEYDEDDPMVRSKLYETTDMLRRYIDGVPKPIQETIDFVKDIHKKIFFLSGVASREISDSRKFPNSRELHALLVRYVELEYEVLYSQEDPSPDYQKEVEKRVLSLLLTILQESATWQERDTLDDDGILDEMCAMNTVYVMTHVKEEYKKKGNFIEKIMNKLMRILDVLDDASEVTNQNGTSPVDKLLQVPKVQKLVTYFQRRDYELENPDVSEDEIEEEVVDQVASPIEEEVTEDEYEEEEEEEEVEEKYNITSCCDTEKKIMTIDLIDEDFSMVYFRPEVQKLNIKDKKSVFDDFNVQISERTLSNISDRFDKYIQLNTTSTTCDNKQWISNISNSNSVLVIDDSDSDIEIIQDGSSCSVLNLESDSTISSELQSPRKHIEIREHLLNSSELEDALLQCDDISDNEIEDEDEILNKYDDTDDCVSDTVPIKKTIIDQDNNHEKKQQNKDSLNNKTKEIENDPLISNNVSDSSSFPITAILEKENTVEAREDILQTKPTPKDHFKIHLEKKKSSIPEKDNAQTISVTTANSSFVVATEESFINTSAAKIQLNQLPTPSVNNEDCLKNTTPIEKTNEEEETCIEEQELTVPINEESLLSDSKPNEEESKKVNSEEENNSEGSNTKKEDSLPENTSPQTIGFENQTSCEDIEEYVEEFSTAFPDHNCSNNLDVLAFVAAEQEKMENTEMKRKGYKKKGKKITKTNKNLEKPKKKPNKKSDLITEPKTNQVDVITRRVTRSSSAQLNYSINHSKCIPSAFMNLESLVTPTPNRIYNLIPETVTENEESLDEPLICLVNENVTTKNPIFDEDTVEDNIILVCHRKQSNNNEVVISIPDTEKDFPGINYDILEQAEKFVDTDHTCVVNERLNSNNISEGFYLSTETDKNKIWKEIVVDSSRKINKHPVTHTEELESSISKKEEEIQSDSLPKIENNIIIVREEEDIVNEDKTDAVSSNNDETIHFTPKKNRRKASLNKTPILLMPVKKRQNYGKKNIIINKYETKNVESNIEETQSDEILENSVVDYSLPKKMSEECLKIPSLIEETENANRNHRENSSEKIDPKIPCEENNLQSENLKLPGKEMDSVIEEEEKEEAELAKTINCGTETVTVECVMESTEELSVSSCYTGTATVEYVTESETAECVTKLSTMEGVTEESTSVEYVTVTQMEKKINSCDIESATVEYVTEPETKECVIEPEIVECVTETVECITEPEAVESVTEPEETDNSVRDPSTVECVTEPEETGDSVTDPSIVEGVTEPETVECAAEPEETADSVTDPSTVECVTVPEETADNVTDLSTVECVTEPEAVECVTELEPVECVTEPEETGDSLTDLSTVECVTEPEAVECVTEPETVECVTEPKTVECVSEPETVECVTEPETVECVTEPEEISESVTDPSTVERVTEPKAVECVTEPEVVEYATESPEFVIQAEVTVGTCVTEPEIVECVGEQEVVTEPTTVDCVTQTPEPILEEEIGTESVTIDCSTNVSQPTMETIPNTPSVKNPDDRELKNINTHHLEEQAMKDICEPDINMNEEEIQTCENNEVPNPPQIIIQEPIHEEIVSTENETFPNIESDEDNNFSQPPPVLEKVESHGINVTDKGKRSFQGEFESYRGVRTMPTLEREIIEEVFPDENFPLLAVYEIEAVTEEVVESFVSDESHKVLSLETEKNSLSEQKNKISARITEESDSSRDGTQRNDRRRVLTKAALKAFQNPYVQLQKLPDNYDYKRKLNEPKAGKISEKRSKSQDSPSKRDKRDSRSLSESKHKKRYEHLEKSESSKRDKRVRHEIKKIPDVIKNKEEVFKAKTRSQKQKEVKIDKTQKREVKSKQSEEKKFPNKERLKIGKELQLFSVEDSIITYYDGRKKPETPKREPDIIKSTKKEEKSSQSTIEEITKPKENTSRSSSRNDKRSSKQTQKEEIEAQNKSVEDLLKSDSTYSTRRHSRRSMSISRAGDDKSDSKEKSKNPSHKIPSDSDKFKINEESTEVFADIKRSDHKRHRSSRSSSKTSETHKSEEETEKKKPRIEKNKENVCLLKNENDLTKKHKKGDVIENLDSKNTENMEPKTRERRGSLRSSSKIKSSLKENGSLSETEVTVSTTEICPLDLSKENRKIPKKRRFSEDCQVDTKNSTYKKLILETHHLEENGRRKEEEETEKVLINMEIEEPIQKKNEESDKPEKFTEIKVHHEAIIEEKTKESLIQKDLLGTSRKRKEKELKKYLLIPIENCNSMKIDKIEVESKSKSLQSEDLKKKKGKEILADIEEEEKSENCISSNGENIENLIQAQEPKTEDSKKKKDLKKSPKLLEDDCFEENLTQNLNLKGDDGKKKKESKKIPVLSKYSSEETENLVQNLKLKPADFKEENESKRSLELSENCPQKIENLVKNVEAKSEIFKNDLMKNPEETENLVKSLESKTKESKKKEESPGLSENCFEKTENLVENVESKTEVVEKKKESKKSPKLENISEKPENVIQNLHLEGKDFNKKTVELSCEKTENLESKTTKKKKESKKIPELLEDYSEKKEDLESKTECFKKKKIPELLENCSEKKENLESTTVDVKKKKESKKIPELLENCSEKKENLESTTVDVKKKRESKKIPELSENPSGKTEILESKLADLKKKKELKKIPELSENFSEKTENLVENLKSDDFKRKKVENLIQNEKKNEDSIQNEEPEGEVFKKKKESNGNSKKKKEKEVILTENRLVTDTKQILIQNEEQKNSKKKKESKKAFDLSENSLSSEDELIQNLIKKYSKNAESDKKKEPKKFKAKIVSLKKIGNVQNEDFKDLRKKRQREPKELETKIKQVDLQDLSTNSKEIKIQDTKVVELGKKKVEEMKKSEAENVESTPENEEKLEKPKKDQTVKLPEPSIDFQKIQESNCADLIIDLKRVEEEPKECFVIENEKLVQNEDSKGIDLRKKRGEEPKIDPETVVLLKLPTVSEEIEDLTQNQDSEGTLGKTQEKEATESEANIKTVNLPESSRDLEKMEENHEEEEEVLADTETIEDPIPKQDSVVVDASNSDDRVLTKSPEDINSEMVIITNHAEILVDERINEKLNTETVIISKKIFTEKMEETLENREKTLIETETKKSLISECVMDVSGKEEEKFESKDKKPVYSTNLPTKQISSKKRDRPESKKKDPKRIDFIIEHLKNRNYQKRKITEHVPEKEEVSTMELSISPQICSENTIFEQAIDFSIPLRERCQPIDHSGVIVHSSEVRNKSLKEFSDCQQEVNVEVNKTSSIVQEEIETGNKETLTIEEASHIVEEESHTMEEQSHTMEEECHTMEEQTHTMDEESPAMEEQSPTIEKAHTVEEKSHTMEEQFHSKEEECHTVVEQSHTMEEESPTMEEESHSMENVHTVEEKSYTMEEQPHTMEEECHTVEEQSPTMEEQSPTMEEQFPTMEEESHSMEKAHTVEEKSHTVEEQPHTMEEQSHTMEEQSPTMEEQFPTMEEESHSMEKAHTVEEKSHTMEEQPHTMEEECHTMEEQSHIMEKECHSMEETHTVDENSYTIEEEPHIMEEAHTVEEKSHTMVEQPYTMEEQSHTMEESHTVKEKSHTMEEEPRTMEAESHTMEEEIHTAEEKLHTMEEQPHIVEEEDCVTIPSSVAEINAALEEDCFIRNVKSSEIVFTETVPNEILEVPEFHKENITTDASEEGNIAPDNKTTENNFKDSCFTKSDGSLPELVFTNEQPLEETDTNSRQEENDDLLDIRSHTPVELINEDSLIEIPDTETVPNEILHFKDHGNKNIIVPISTTSKTVIQDHAVPSTSSTHSINNYSVPIETNLDVDKQPEEVIVNSSTSTSCETTDNLIAVIFSNVALCNNTEVPSNQPNKTGFIYFRGTDHNYHSVGDPLLSGKCDNNESDNSSENSKEIPTPELENVLVDDNILPYIPTLTENNLNQELSESPVDSSTDFQLLEQCLIGNTLARESSPPLPQGCDNLYQTNLKQEVLDYDDNSSGNIELEFKQPNSEVYINQFQQPTMSVENMSELMNAVLTRIQNLNNMTRPTQRYESSKENLLPPLQTELNENIQTTNTNSNNFLTNLESDCNFIPMQEINSYPECNVEYSNISFGNDVPEPVSFETDFTNFYYLPVAHETTFNNPCNKKVIVERIPQYSEQQMKSYTEINNAPSVVSPTPRPVTTIKPTTSIQEPRSSNKTTEIPKPTNILIEKLKQNDNNNSDPVPTPTTINVGFVRTSSRTRVSAPRPKKPSDRKSVDTSEESGPETNLNNKPDNHVLKLKVRADLGITNNTIVETVQGHTIVPAKERSLCIIEDSNGSGPNKHNRLLIEEKLETRRSNNKQPKDIPLNIENVNKLNVKTQTKQPKEEDLTKTPTRHDKPQKQPDCSPDKIKTETCNVKDAKSQTNDVIVVQNKPLGKESQKGHSDMIDNVKRRKRKPVDYIERVDYSSIDKLLGVELGNLKLPPQKTKQKKEDGGEVSPPRPKKRKEIEVKLKTTCKPLSQDTGTCKISDTEPDVVNNPKTSIFEDSDDDVPLKKKSKPLEPDSMNDLFDRLVKEGNINTIKNTPKQNKNENLNETFNKSLLDPSPATTRAISNNIFNLEPKKPDSITPVKQIGVVNPIRRSSNVVRKEPPVNRNNSYSGSEESRNSQYYPYYSDRSRRSYPYSNRESSRSSHQGSSRRMEYQPHSSDQRYSSSQRSSSSARSSRSSRHHSNSRSSTEQRNYNRYASSAATDLAWREDMKKKFPNMFKDEVYF